MKSIAEILNTATLKASSSCNNVKTGAERLQRLADRENAIEGNKHLADGYNCDICKNKGYTVRVIGSDGDYELAQSPCVCEKSRRSIRNLKASGLENVLTDYTLDNYNATEPWQSAVLNKVKQFLSDEGNHWLFMGGASGSGKTHLCSAVAIELLRRGIEVKYMLWKSESRKIKNDNFDGGNLIEYYKNVEVLYIDDLFKCGRARGEEYQSPTGGDINIAFEIINSRVAQKKRTIISSESTILELFEIDEATAGRIKQMCGEYCLNISKGEGKNYRKREFL
jgi:DNA replication protein DnaC